MANAQSGRIAGLLSQNMDYSGEPTGGNAFGILGAPSARTSFGGGGPITTSYGPADNFSADRQRVEDSLMSRMNPQLQIQQQALQQQLADQGIRYGSDAYNNAMLTYNQQANDARWGAISQAGQEQQRMVNEAAQQASFQNQAQAQQYQQNAGQAQFYNAGAAQNLQQQQAFFNAQQAQQNQWLQQAYAARNQPINEITSLLSGSQVNQPNFVNTPGAQISTTDVAGLVNQNFNQQLANYQQQNQNYNSLIGGVLGLGAGALKLSDEREKENIVKMGDILADKTEKLPIYEYEYKKDPSKTRHLGPMAQDVERIDPKSVTTVEGIKYINEPRMMGRLLGV